MEMCTGVSWYHQIKYTCKWSLKIWISYTIHSVWVYLITLFCDKQICFCPIKHVQGGYIWDPRNCGHVGRLLLLLYSATYTSLIFSVHPNTHTHSFSHKNTHTHRGTYIHTHTCTPTHTIAHTSTERERETYERMTVQAMQESIHWLRDSHRTWSLYHLGGQSYHDMSLYSWGFHHHHLDRSHCSFLQRHPILCRLTSTRLLHTHYKHLCKGYVARKKTTL